MKIEDGSLRIRSSRTAARYLGDGADALADADGFVNTRDMVELRGDRYYFIGRKDGIINVGGLKVHPEEVEAIINRHPSVQMSLVSGRKKPDHWRIGRRRCRGQVRLSSGHRKRRKSEAQRRHSRIMSSHAGPIQSADPNPVRFVARGSTLRKVGAALMQTVIVTGGSRGLGLGIARKLVAAGYQVIAIARHESEQLACAMRPKEPGQKTSLFFKAFDLEDTSGIPNLVKELRKEFGSIHGLVNNAGLGTSGILGTMHDSQIERLVRLNTVSSIILTKYVLRSMMADGGGRIVNVASIVGLTGYSGLSVYSATKASMIGFTRSLAREVGPLGINVNAVAPGFLDTEMTDSLTGPQREQIARRSALHRLAEVDDVANAVEFLLSDKARNITGTVLTVDAGNTA